MRLLLSSWIPPSLPPTTPDSTPVSTPSCTLRFHSVYQLPTGVSSGLTGLLLSLPQQLVCLAPLLLVGSSLPSLALLLSSIAVCLFLRESDAPNVHTALVLRNMPPPPHSPLCAA